MRFRLSPVAISVLCAFAPAAYGADEPLILKLDRTFNVMPDTPDATPAFINARHIEGKKESQIVATGDAELRKHGQAIFADRLVYMQNTKEVIADGSVRVEQGGDVMSGPHLELNMDTSIGDMTQPVFHLGANDARGNADSMHMEGRKNYTLHNVAYTSCPAGNDDWLLKMSRLDIDRETQVGAAHDAYVEFKGVPILYTPWMDFALNDNRKTGFLGPVFGGTTTGGSEVTLPFYWNIAPNRDATIAPRVMTKRGLLLSNEFRYLEPNYAGEAHVDVLPGDRLANRTRSYLALKHAQNLGGGFSGSVNFNRVSDDAYFRDLSSSVTGTSQVNLLREGVLNYGGSWWNAAARVQSYQTLQDPAAPVGVPYRRLPQLSVDAQHGVDKGALSFSGEFVDFRHPTAVNGQRLVLYPSVSYPLVSDPAYYLTPKIGLHNTTYRLGVNNTGNLPNTASRTLPIFSLDSGMTLERDWNFAGESFVQTLEPRVYYVYIPYRNQDALPNFDSAQATFSFAQMFTENRFFGSDRVGDANQVTLAMTSRFLDPNSGIERLRLAMGQRFSLATPRVNLVAPTVTTNKSDILLAASGRLTRTLSLDSLLQYNPTQSRSEMFNASARYRPESGKVLNLGYRFTRASVRQIDLSEQWPLYGRWNSVARWNYSLQEKRLLEGLLGLEYNQSCWTVRLVAQRFTTATFQASTGFFVQLELNDLVRVGSDPLDALRQSVPGYTKMNQTATSEPVQGLR
ncbi:MAG: LPS assembly protein LptD [Sideroxydans sp.]|nr:LPS assembly protein LptD [Sideroxydans sp.]